MEACLPSSEEIFPAVKLRPQNPPIDKREIGDAAIPGNANTCFSPQLGPLANLSAQSQVTSRCDVRFCGGEELHHFLPVLLRGMLSLFSIVTL